MNIDRSHPVSRSRSRSMMMWMFDQLLVALDPRAGLLLASFSLASLAVVVAAEGAQASQRVSEFKLKNGLHVLVIPDHRAPVVTQMVWYKVGAADEPPGSSGIAHFLEHLMFKGTEEIPPGQFSKLIAKNGGEDNAFTNHDVTAYFQRVAKDRLPKVMQMEADRMANLRLSEEDVATERKVILEERRSRVDNDPGSILQEQMMAALYSNHPYGIPIIGWEHEIRALGREDALSFYKRFYAPDNVLLVIAGDVEEDVVRRVEALVEGKRILAAERPDLVLPADNGNTVRMIGIERGHHLLLQDAARIVVDPAAALFQNNLALRGHIFLREAEIGHAVGLHLHHLGQAILGHALEVGGHVVIGEGVVLAAVLRDQL